jgi:hypothetical protein
MAKINASLLLVYADGVVIASQKNCTVNWEQDLPLTTDKQTAGWETHINGVRRATCDFDGLYSTTGLSAEALIDLIVDRVSILLVIDGGGFPIVGEAKPKNISVNAPMEDAVTISGSFVFKGPAWLLSGVYENLITDPDAGGTDYDTLTVSGLAITSAINASGGANCDTNNFSITNASSYKLVCFLTKTSGQLPTAVFYYPSLNFSNIVQLVEGHQFSSGKLECIKHLSI